MCGRCWLSCAACLTTPYTSWMSCAPRYLGSCGAALLTVALLRYVPLVLLPLQGIYAACSDELINTGSVKLQWQGLQLANILHMLKQRSML